MTMIRSASGEFAASVTRTRSPTETSEILIVAAFRRFVSPGSDPLYDCGSRELSHGGWRTVRSDLNFSCFHPDRRDRPKQRSCRRRLSEQQANEQKNAFHSNRYIDVGSSK